MRKLQFLSKQANKMTPHSLVLTTIMGSIAFMGCGSDSSTTTTATATGSLNFASTVGLSTSGSASRLSSRTTAVPSAIAASSTHFSFAKVDGVKVTVTEVRGTSATSDNPLTTQAINEEIELLDDATNPVAFTKEIAWGLGDYSGVDVLVSNKWSVKAYCKTALSGSNFKLVYTTAAGPAVTDCTTSSCDLPSDYGYSSYTWLNDDYTRLGTDVFVQTHTKFSIAAGTTPKVSMFFDPTNSVACWDGIEWAAGDGYVNLIGYFNNGTSASTRERLWPGTTPAFTMGSFPLLTYVTTDATEATLKSRTFFQASAESSLTPTVVMGLTQTMTILYAADGTPVTASARNILSGSASNPMDFNFDGMEKTTSGISFYSAGWFWDGTSNPPELVKNRKFSAFNMPSTRYTPFAVTVEDGPHCGMTKNNTDGSNASKDCLGTGVSSTVYFKEAARE
jgi:hypothetical protein